MTFQPDWAVHPGEILRELLEDLRLSVRVAATATGIGEEALTAVLKGRAPITEDIARRLAVLPVSGRLWLNLQRDHDASLARGAEALRRQEGLVAAWEAEDGRYSDEALEPFLDAAERAEEENQGR